MNRRPMIMYSAVVVGLLVLLSAWAWIQLPADAVVPVHWGLDGQADVFSDKSIGLFFLPVLVAGAAALLAVIPRFEPRRANLERSGKAYGATWIAVITLLGLVDVLFVAAALGAEFDMIRIVMVGIGALFIVVGNYLPTVRPNYLMGIRTPWTLASDLSWVKTHRVGGRLFVIDGLVLAVLGIIGVAPQVLFAAIFGSLALVLVVVFAYSYRVWKIDPQKRAA